MWTFSPKAYSHSCAFFGTWTNRSRTSGNPTTKLPNTSLGQRRKKISTEWANEDGILDSELLKIWNLVSYY